jgi:lipopolysaccharide export system permease protein
MKTWRLTILDRYMLTELSGPAGFGLAAFTLIFAATQILAIGRAVSDQHAPLWAAVEVFLWDLPGIVALVIPMALLLGTLLAIARLSGDSEITAMKASGVTFGRIVAPVLVAGFVMSFVTIFLQEIVAPFANTQVAWIENTVINNTGTFGRDLTVSAPLPGGGRQVTFATAEDPGGNGLLHLTLVQYDAQNRPTKIIFADRAQFLANQWNLQNVSTYIFDANGDTTSLPNSPSVTVALGEDPADIAKRIANDDPQQMSRSQISQILQSNQLTATERAKYVTTYWQKLAQPFACFVFTLIAVPFGLRSIRGGNNASLGFGLAVAIVFVYYIVMTICSYLSAAMLPLAFFWAWAPNLLFTAIGLTRLRRAAAV